MLFNFKKGSFNSSDIVLLCSFNYNTRISVFNEKEFDIIRKSKIDYSLSYSQPADFIGTKEHWEECYKIKDPKFVFDYGIMDSKSFMILPEEYIILKNYLHIDDIIIHNNSR